MTSSSSEYCKVYVDAPVSADDLARLISGRFGISLPWNTVRSGSLELEVHENESFLSPQRRRHQNDFVLYRLYIDIEPIPGTTRDSYIREISDLLTWLWGQGFPAVAACDFENELPKHELGSIWSPERGESKGTVK